MARKRMQRGGEEPGGRSFFTRLATVGGVLLVVGGAVALGGCMERFFYYPTRALTPPPPDLPGARMVRFASADGTALSGWFVPAAGTGGAAGDPGPAVLHVHGNAGNVESHIGFTEFLPAAGYHLLLFDYRGYGESAGSARRREPLLADAHAALDALLAREEVDPDRVSVFGQSLGGAIALNLVAERPEPRGAVIVSAFSSWRDVAAQSLGGERPGLVARGLARLLIRDHLRPDEAIARIDRPVLLIHGDADELVPFAHAGLLADRAPDARLVRLADVGHNDVRDAAGDFDRTVVGFLDAAIREPAAE